MTRLQMLRRRLGLLDGKSVRAAAAARAARTVEKPRAAMPASNWGRIIHE
ncbi:hypothetical protein [uncultured Sphingomonas sp.]|nr:hypothetical protein [uncultured Sphingomonas sp.]